MLNKYRIIYMHDLLDFNRILCIWLCIDANEKRLNFIARMYILYSFSLYIM